MYPCDISLSKLDLEKQPTGCRMSLVRNGNFRAGAFVGMLAGRSSTFDSYPLRIQ